MNRLYPLTLILLIGCGSRDQTKAVSPKPAATTTKPTPPPNTPPSTNPADWIFSRTDSTRLVFTSGRTMETNLYNLNYIGQIPLQHKAPLLIFSGRGCRGCDANISIYMHSPSDGKLDVEFGGHRYKWPGKEADYFTDKHIYTSRAFYGQVLKDTIGVIWYEKRMVENGRWEHDVFLSWMDHDTRIDTMYFYKGHLDQTLKLLGQGLCREIQGQEYKTEP